jgi:hypothetical protein
VSHPEFFTTFRQIRQEQKEWRITLKKEISRRNGHRKRVDIPIGWIIDNKPQVPVTSSEDLERLKDIIRQNNQ